MTNPTFPHGLRVFLRTAMPDGSLHFTDLVNARGFASQEHEFFLTLTDENNKPVAFFILDALSMILPLAAPTPPQQMAQANSEVPA